MTVLAVVMAFGAFSGPAAAQDPLELEEYTEETAYREDWGLAITPYAWFAAQSTDVGNQQLRSSFNDLASITNLGFQCRLYASYKWLVFAADWTYADMKSESEILNTALDFKISQNILDVKLGGKIYDTRTTGQNGGVGIWVSAGARYWDNTVDYTVTTTPVLPGQDPSVEAGQEGQRWWDPVLGVNMHFPVTPRVGFLVRATGGGFGAGNASDYMWDAEFAALFRLTGRMLLSAGYRQFKYRRDDGGVKQTVTVIGPAVGLSVGIL
jgi:hypothetical protein